MPQASFKPGTFRSRVLRQWPTTYALPAAPHWLGLDRRAVNSVSKNLSHGRHTYRDDLRMSIGSGAELLRNSAGRSPTSPCLFFTVQNNLLELSSRINFSPSVAPICKYRKNWDSWLTWISPSPKDDVWNRTCRINRIGMSRTPEIFFFRAPIHWKSAIPVFEVGLTFYSLVE